MALTVPWPDPTGVLPMGAAHLVWSGLYIEPTTRSIRVAFDVYRDRAAYDARRHPVDQVAYTLAGAEFDAFLGGHGEVSATIAALVYEFARTRPELAGATPAPA